MYSEISKFFKREFPLKEHGLEELFSLLKVKSYKKGSRLIIENEYERNLRFLNKGIIREYFSNEGNERNINFYVKPQFISDFLAFNQMTVTKKNQECLTNVEVLSIERDLFFNLLEKYECAKELVDQSFKRMLKHKEMLEYNRTTKSPEELYNELFIYKPEWLLNIPQYHIASYLNITPETLSRIRKRIS